MVLASRIPVSNAAIHQLIIINSKNNTLNFYENYTLVRKFKCTIWQIVMHGYLDNME